jgi:hypothetical protein
MQTRQLVGINPRLGVSFLAKANHGATINAIARF